MRSNIFLMICLLLFSFAGFAGEEEDFDAYQVEDGYCYRAGKIISGGKEACEVAAEKATRENAIAGGAGVSVAGVVGFLSKQAARGSTTSGRAKVIQYVGYSLAVALGLVTGIQVAGVL